MPGWLSAQLGLLLTGATEAAGLHCSNGFAPTLQRTAVSHTVFSQYWIPKLSNQNLIEYRGEKSRTTELVRKHSKI